jgi:4'-phosphopantetheinyl transferase
LEPAELDAAFLRAWACKEAVVKASGQGIANQLSRFTVEIDPARPARVLEYDGDLAEAWSLALLRPEEDFLGAIAARSARLDVNSFRLLPAAGDAAN